MKKTLLLLFLALLNFVSAQKQQNDILFKNVNIVTLENEIVLKNQSIVIKDGKIIAIENTKKSKYKAKEIIDLKGKYIMPSMADAHVHLPEKEEELQRFLELNVINGVTKLRSMRGDWRHKAWKEKYNTKESYHPKLYLSSPPITRNLEDSPDKLDAFVKATKDNGFGFVKVLSIKSQDMFITLDSLCKKHDVVLGGHFPRLASGNSLNENVFFSSNYKSIEHLGGLVGEPNLFESRIQAIKKNNIFICPTLLWYSIGSGQNSYEELQKLPGMEYVSKTTMQEWIEKTKQYREKTGEVAYKEEVAKELKSLDEKYQVINRLQKEGIKMLLSPDASSKYMMTGCNIVSEMELLQKAGLSNYQILQMATTNFAQFYKETNGILKVDNDADFIILESNPLENIQTLKNVKGLYFNSNYLPAEKLMEMKTNLILSSQN